MLPQPHHPIMASSTVRESVYSGSTLALTSPTRVDRIRLSSALSVFDDKPQGKGNPEVAGNPGEVRLTRS